MTSLKTTAGEDSIHVDLIISLFLFVVVVVGRIV